MHAVRTQSTLKWTVHLSVLFLVALWIFPTTGLFVSSFRTVDQISSGGWWASMLSAEQNLVVRAAKPSSQVQDGNLYVIEGDLFAADKGMVISAWGISSKAIGAYKPNQFAELRKGGRITVTADGHFRMVNSEPFIGSRGQRIFFTAQVPPEFTLANYHEMLFDSSNIDGMAGAFLATMTVTVPATIIPILIAAFAAYALAWMRFPGRAMLIAVVVGLLVVPLQLALIPLLKLHMNIGIGKGYIGVWLAHTGFGLPLAIYLLRNYMAGLPRDIIENARVDGATEFQIFTRIILPLSYPALASFAIFQFLWTWNDLLVAKVFLIDATGQTIVMTAKIVELLGTYGGNWEILATSAFVSIAVPLAVFFTLQKYLVRGLLAGSVK
ncbi:MAG: carbohydrate ABC transporter permease [Gammaproteobacteria bacterium]|nr:carbohydrate ABC transporter permease [Gammaproteobacteria bacterium]MCP4880908.1 carbohydrate ABC transporter permease [Gammaproteobacteria bacterium]MDP6164526.1 carbohydrate ABC transporter permease [Gammaproteobacteria bacterium]